MVFETCQGLCPAPSLVRLWDAAFQGELTKHCLGQTPRSDGFAQRRHGSSPGMRCAASMPAMPAAPCSRACQPTAFTGTFLQKLSPGSLPQHAYLLLLGFAAKRLLARVVFTMQLSGMWPCFGVGAVCQNPSKASASWRGDLCCPPRCLRAAHTPWGCPHTSQQAGQRGQRAGGCAGDSSAASPLPMKAECLFCKLPASVSLLN